MAKARELSKEERELLDAGWESYIEAADTEYDEYNHDEVSAQIKRVQAAWDDYNKLMDDMGIIVTFSGYRKTAVINYEYRLN